MLSSVIPQICLHKLHGVHQGSHIQQGQQSSNTHGYRGVDGTTHQKGNRASARIAKLNNSIRVRNVACYSIGSKHTTFCRPSISGDAVYTGVFKATWEKIQKRCKSQANLVRTARGGWCKSTALSGGSDIHKRGLSVLKQANQTTLAASRASRSLFSILDSVSA